MAFLVGFVATMVVVGGCFMMAEGLILNGLLVIVLGLIGASPLVWRQLPHHDVLLRRPDAQEAELGIAFDQPCWRGAAAAALSAVLGLLIVAGGVKTLAEGFADVNGSQLANLIQGSIAGVLGGGLVAFGIVSARGRREPLSAASRRDDQHPRVLPSQPEATRRGRHGGLRAARSTHHRRG